MARVDYRRRKMFQIYAVALLLILSVFMLSACNADSGAFDVSGGSVNEPSHFIAKLMYGLDDDIAVFGWSVVAFTVILKLVLSPLDIWQKVISRRNAKAMERMRPQLEALAEKYGDDKQRYQQEQMALYKKEKYSMLGACLPSLITLVVFFVVFTGFREMVGYQFAQDYVTSYNVFEQTMEEELGEGWESYDKTESNAVAYNDAVDKAQTAVYEFYFSPERTEKRGFLWIKNIFVSDNWQDGVPDYLVATGQEGFGMSRITGVMKDEYELVMDLKQKFCPETFLLYGRGNREHGFLHNLCGTSLYDCVYGHPVSFGRGIPAICGCTFDFPSVSMHRRNIASLFRKGLCPVYECLYAGIAFKILLPEFSRLASGYPEIR